ncbi:MAG: hypothetical protein H6R25_1060 [Proteobacteria bacterium]|nr:hypothetical protein [Pseudomonadota bacterium]
MITVHGVPGWGSALSEVIYHKFYKLIVRCLRKSGWQPDWSHFDKSVRMRCATVAVS